MRQVSLRQGATLLERGDPIEDVYFPQTGLISLLVLGRDGGVTETATVGREGAIGFHGVLGGRRSFTRATTQIGGRFSTIRAGRFEHIVNDSVPVRDLIQRYTEVLLAEAQQIGACNATHGARARLCRWLLQCADRTGRDELSLIQEFLAQMLGVRRTTVTLLAQSLQVRGLIRYRRGRIVLLDRKGLEECACECYDIMRHEKLGPALGVHVRRMSPLMGRKRVPMAMYYFHLEDDETIVDSDGTDLVNTAAAHAHAVAVARELTAKSTGLLDQKLSGWTMSVHDDSGLALFSLAMSDFGDDNSEK